MIPEFLTHIAKTNNKIADNKYIKINSQSIYNGALARFSRAIVVNNIHEYIESFIGAYKGLNIDYPVAIQYEFHTVLNHGSISMRKGKINYKPVKDNYKPNFDLENLAGIWIKCGNDTLVKNKVIIDDNVSIIREVSYKFIPVDDLNKRKIVINISPI